MGLARHRGRSKRQRILVLLAVALTFAVTGSCRAQPAATHSKIAAFLPDETRTLRAFGAAGDDRADDTAAIQRGLRNADRYCLDGEDRTYRVYGSLRVQKNLCLRNVTLDQSQESFDTTPYISRPCPGALNASAVVDCGDRAVPPDELPRLLAFLNVRTLLIRPDRPGGSIQVTLDHVKVVRGRYPEAGSRADSAGIWLEGASRADLRDVEVTGYGKGYGLIVLRSSNVTVDNLYVHDLVWSPYRGDAPLTQARMEQLGWNSAPIHEFRAARSDGQSAAKFYGVRVQEQITCALFSEVHIVVIRNARILHCMARFEDGDLPWQADGLDISHSSSNVRIDRPVIDSTWEGMDIVANGRGLNGLTIDNPRVSNSFGFGLKLGYHLTGARISNATVANAGIAGIVIYGPVSNIIVSEATVSGVGVVEANGKLLSPWRGQPHSGIRIDDGPSGNGVGRLAPRDVTIQDVTVSNAGNSPRYEFGLLNTGGSNVRAQGFRATGFREAQISGAVKIGGN